MAGGRGLLRVTDMAVAADHALFGLLPEVKIGFFPMQVLSRLQSIVPYPTVRKWCLTGEPLGAAEAKEGGLLNYEERRPVWAGC
jgi:enoyl-CoA hydratase/carnithine racemase